ncbi:MAG: primosomal protein N' [Candidatus Eisenbacteria bacterium]|nr:primosomal protein N' [Candidatus Eisenbacteria bacterium]
MSPLYLDVAVPLPVYGTYTYSVPGDLEVRAEVGTRVLVPFGRRKLTGFVVGHAGTTEVEGVKDIIDVLDVGPVLDRRMLDLTKWVADYYLAPWGEVLKSALPPGINMESRRCVRLTGGGRTALNEGAPGLTGRQRALLEELADRDSATVATALRAAGVPRGSHSELDSMVRKGYVELFEELRPPRTSGGRESVVRLTIEPGEAASLVEELGSRAPRQAQVVSLVLAAGGEAPVAEIARQGLSSSVVRRLCERGVAEKATVEKARLSTGLEGWGLREEGPLTAEQKTALDRIRERVDGKEFGVVLLHGVTGSGKTRVYSEAVAAARETGRGAIILVPEIALTPQMVVRMRMDFGDEVAVIHSGLSLTERYDTWRAVKAGTFRIVVGPRSAVFAPVRDLGVIVVDEEHESTYKQSESPRYHARDVAIMRARNEAAVVVLGSATPSLESYLNARDGKYDLVELPERIDSGPLPDVEIVDMRDEGAVDPEGAFSQRLIDSVSETLEAEKQVILFLNRRGFASFIQCTKCGHSERCPDCNVSLTYHASDRTMRCHYCGTTRPAPSKCPECASIDLRFGAPGTQRVEKAVRAIFPDAVVERMDVDTTSRHGSHWRILKDFAEGRTDVLLGTQMIAKGLDFPGVGLVGVISADVGLNLPDFRSAERTFQLLTQVAGRTGRGGERGRVVVQTYLPEHYTVALAKAQEFLPFFDREVEERESVGIGYPPFTRLVSIVAKGRDESHVIVAASRLASFLDDGAAKMEPGPEVLGPAPAPLERIRGVYRWQVIVRGKGGGARALVAAALSQTRGLKLPAGVSFTVDVDPLDLL